MRETRDREDVIAGIDFDDECYQIEQALIRNKYSVMDSNGRLVCRAKQTFFRLKTEFPFVDADGNEIFTIKAKNTLDIAGDYALVDDRTGETVVIIEKQFSIFKHVWKIRDPESEQLLATLESRSIGLEVLRNVSMLASLLPHKYDIERADGTELGSIDGRFSVRDRYELAVGDTVEVPRETIVAAAIAIDALEGN